MIIRDQKLTQKIQDKYGIIFQEGFDNVWEIRDYVYALEEAYSKASSAKDWEAFDLLEAELDAWSGNNDLD